MATKHTVVNITKVIELSAEDIEAILKAQFQVEGDVVWDVSLGFTVNGATITQHITEVVKDEVL